MILSKPFQCRIPSPNSVLKGSGDEIVVLVQGDGGGMNNDTIILFTHTFKKNGIQKITK